MASGLIISLETIRNTHPAESIQRLPDRRKQMGQFCVSIFWIDMKNLTLPRFYLKPFRNGRISVSGQEATALQELGIRDDEEHFHRAQASSRLGRERRATTADGNRLLPANSLFSKGSCLSSLCFFSSSALHIVCCLLLTPQTEIA